MAPFYGWDQLSVGYRATLRRQFTFYRSVSRSLWFSFNRHQKDERRSQPAATWWSSTMDPVIGNPTP